jgi:SAM-dependent methyltransferase
MEKNESLYSLNEEHFNIKEQRFWNQPFNDGGHEWSVGGSTELLWENEISRHAKKWFSGKGLEIAPGEGRMTEYLLTYCQDLHLLDLNKHPLSVCMNKFGNRCSGYFVNDGKSIPQYFTNNLDFIFSWDSFVHIHWDIFKIYLNEISRSLKSGGVFFIHHAHYFGGSEFSFQNYSGRANLDLEDLDQEINNLDMEILEQYWVKISCEEPNFVDCVTLARKR